MQMKFKFKNLSSDDEVSPDYTVGTARCYLRKRIEVWGIYRYLRLYFLVRTPSHFSTEVAASLRTTIDSYDSCKTDYVQLVETQRKRGPRNLGILLISIRYDYLRPGHYYHHLVVQNELAVSVQVDNFKIIYNRKENLFNFDDPHYKDSDIILNVNSTKLYCNYAILHNHSVHFWRTYMILPYRYDCTSRTKREIAVNLDNDLKIEDFKNFLRIVYGLEYDINYCNFKKILRLGMCLHTQCVINACDAFMTDRLLDFDFYDLKIITKNKIMQYALHSYMPLLRNELELSTKSEEFQVFMRMEAIRKLNNT